MSGPVTAQAFFFSSCIICRSGQDVNANDSYRMCCLVHIQFTEMEQTSSVFKLSRSIKTDVVSKCEVMIYRTQNMTHKGKYLFLDNNTTDLNNSLDIYITLFN